MKFCITYRVYATFDAQVDASSIEEATDKAETLFSEADFGDASNIDGEVCCVADEDGTPLWLKWH